jgi:tRNA(adenine34) deaminase
MDALPSEVSLSQSFDGKMMKRCIELSRVAASHGELPFASIICRDGQIVAEAGNRVVAEGDVTRHAELIAVSEAQRVLGKRRLKGCTIYSNVEPCVMCSMPIREAGINRVVYSICSPVMGGFSRWNVLGDHRLSRAMPIYFRRPPEIVAGLLAQEAEMVWKECRPILWRLIKLRGCFTVPVGQN